ncbi:MAG TPA: ABC transporter substrate-binding protein [Gemmatimonadales bacterium]|nr:ABC transporter substrate-binding protein [Gemmatimonadales bacterium]
MSNQINRRSLIKGAAGAAAGAATVGVSKRSTAFAAPAVIQETGSQVKVLFWSSWGAKIGEVEQEVIKRFNESQQDVVIEHQFQGTYEETAQKVIAGLQARQAPDLTVLSEANWFRFYANQYLAPMDDFIASEEIDTSDYVESFLTEGQRQGQQWWMSFARSTPLFYYNKQLWEEAGLEDRGPQTYSEFSEWGPKLVKKSGNDVTQWGFLHPPATNYIAWYFQGTIWAFDGAYSDEEFNILINEPNSVKAGEWLRSTVADGWATASQDRITDFLNGVTASMMESTGQLANLRDNATFEYGASFLPSEVNPGCPTGGAGLGILSTAPTEKQQAAFKYIAFATSPEITAYWSQNTGYMPVRKSAGESPEMQAFYEENPLFRTAVDQLATTKPQDPARRFVPAGDLIIGKGLEELTVNQAEVQPTFDQVKTTLEEEAQPILEQLAAIEG